MIVFLFFTYISIFCLFFQLIVRHCRKKQWVPIDSQVWVYGPKTSKKQRKTAIDLLCEDIYGRIILIEIKTRSVSMERHQETYKLVDETHPKTSIGLSNSLYWKHQAQLNITTKLFKHSYKRAKKKTVLSIILAVVENTVFTYPLRCK